MTDELSQEKYIFEEISAEIMYMLIFKHKDVQNIICFLSEKYDMPESVIDFDANGFINELLLNHFICKDISEDTPYAPKLPFYC